MIDSSSRLHNIHSFLLMKRTNFIKTLWQNRLKHNKLHLLVTLSKPGEGSSAGITFLIKGPAGPPYMSSFLQPRRQELVVGWLTCGDETIMGLRAPCWAWGSRKTKGEQDTKDAVELLPQSCSVCIWISCRHINRNPYLVADPQSCLINLSNAKNIYHNKFFYGSQWFVS